MADKKTYKVVGFYCEIHKEWHYIREDVFHECMDRYNSHFGFKVEVKDDCI